MVDHAAPKLSLPRALGNCRGIRELWYRAERQSLRRLPKTGAIAFTIRVHICALESLASVDGALESLWQAVADAPEDLQRYKGLDILAPVMRAGGQKTNFRYAA